MDVVVAVRVARSSGRVPLRTSTAVPLLLCLAASSAWAFDENPSTALVAQAEAPMPLERLRSQVEVSTRALPRFDNIDGATTSSRIDLTWLPPRRSALGVSLGMTSLSGSEFPARAPLAGASNVDLGLHWRYTLDSHDRVDVTAWRRMTPPDAVSLVESREPSYGARVEMRLRPVASSGFVADRGFLGFQLESGARITLRRSGGRPMVYYRSKF